MPHVAGSRVGRLMGPFSRCLHSVMVDLLNRLKIETAAWHSALESALDLMRPSLSRDEYIALLASFRGFVAPWEVALEASVPAAWQPFVRTRHKTALLDADLAFLCDSNIPRFSEMSASALRQSVPFDSLGQALGSMYVMEGSTLGGRIIGPAMASRFGLSDHRGYAYFDPYRDRTGSMWKAFKEAAAEGVPVTQYDAAVVSAQQTFIALQRWLVPMSVPEAVS